MFVCMYVICVCLHVCMSCVCVCMHVWPLRMFVRMYVMYASECMLHRLTRCTNHHHTGGKKTSIIVTYNSEAP